MWEISTWTLKNQISLSLVTNDYNSSQRGQLRPAASLRLRCSRRAKLTVQAPGVSPSLTFTRWKAGPRCYITGLLCCHHGKWSTCARTHTGLLRRTWPHCAVCVCMETRQGVAAVIEKVSRRCSQVIVSGCFEEPVRPVWTEFPLNKSSCMSHDFAWTSGKIILGCFCY